MVCLISICQFGVTRFEGSYLGLLISILMTIWSTLFTLRYSNFLDSCLLFALIAYFMGFIKAVVNFSLSILLVYTLLMFRQKRDSVEAGRKCDGVFQNFVDGFGKTDLHSPYWFGAKKHEKDYTSSHRSFIGKKVK